MMQLEGFQGIDAWQEKHVLRPVLGMLCSAMESRNRRELLKDLGLVVTGGYLATSRGYAANERLRIGCIGVGGRGQHLMRGLVKIPGREDRHHL